MVSKCPYREKEVAFRLQMDPEEFNSIITRLTVRQANGEDSIIVPNEKIAAACRNHLNHIMQEEGHECQTIADLGPPRPRHLAPLAPLSDSPLEDFDPVAEMLKRANGQRYGDADEEGQEAEATRAAKKGQMRVAPEKDEAVDVEFFSPSPPSLVIRDNRSSIPVGFLLPVIDLSAPPVRIAPAGLGNSKDAPIELDTNTDTDSDDEQGISEEEMHDLRQSSDVFVRGLSESHHTDQRSISVELEVEY